jgi:sarcosine oxidase subunit beta
VCRERAELSALLGSECSFVEPNEISRLCPQLDMTCGGQYPVLAGLWHPPAAIIRHDAVVWAFAAGANRLGVGVHQGIEVTSVDVEQGKCLGVQTSSGAIAAERVVCATGGSTSLIVHTSDIRLPIVTHPLQAFVTEPVKPILNLMLASSELLVYISQTDRGEILVGAEIDPYASYSTTSTWEFLRSAAARTLDLLPFTGRLHIQRQWAGICDMSPDYAPIISATEVEGFFVSTGWGTWGFKAGPAGGKCLAELVATGKSPTLIEPFGLDRYWRDRAVSERGSAGTHTR